MLQIGLNNHLPSQTPSEPPPPKEKFAQRPFPKDEKKVAKSSKPHLFDLVQKKKKAETIDPQEGLFFCLKENSSTLIGQECEGGAIIEGIDEQIELLSDKILAGFEVIHHKGICKTRLVLHPPNPLSIFNGTEIELTQYDTSPLTLNIEFFGTEAANLLLVSSVAAFEKSLKENLKETKIERIDFSLRSKSHQHKKVTQTDEF